MTNEETAITNDPIETENNELSTSKSPEQKKPVKKGRRIAMLTSDSERYMK